MPDTHREIVLQALAQALTGVTVANGYIYDLGLNVKRSHFSNFDDDVPLMVLIDGPETISLNNYNAETIVMQVSIEAHVKETLNDMSSVVINQVQGEIRKEIEKTSSPVFDVVDRFQCTSFTPYYWQDERKIFGLQLTYDLTWWIVPGDPYTRFQI